MELIHLVMNLVIPPVFLIILLVALPPYLLYKFLFTIIRMFTLEDLAGKVVLITGASSGIGEQLAYEYAKKGARLALVDIREKLLQEVARKARTFGSPDTIIIFADVSKADDCKRFVQETVNHFGKLDHLVNNAGIISVFYFEEATNFTNMLPIMDTNFWGSVYPSHFALPHLKKSKGKIVVLASVTGSLYAPSISIYGASKAALINFYDTLRVEFGSSITITIVSPGFVKSEMTKGKHLCMDGRVEIDKAKIDRIRGYIPMRGTNECAKVIVDAVRRGDRHVIEPSWYKILCLCKFIAPELVEWVCHYKYVLIPNYNMKRA
ncbi:11beta-hydroxysteroid dehydrogenase [Ranunculus cassubicifolius]